uniref:PiggyBac transposable element-derived protein domain-containing protein n=1 Tax=Octopus bimaculoides TaxID=37653 RepID=A0A0L8I753_OCTBM
MSYHSGSINFIIMTFSSNLQSLRQATPSSTTSPVVCSSSDDDSESVYFPSSESDDSDSYDDLPVNQSTKANLKQRSSPLEIFHEFLTDEMFQYIADRIYATLLKTRPGHGSDWFPTTGDKIKVAYSADTDGHHEETEPGVILELGSNYVVPFFLEMMPHDQFLALLRNVHFNSGKNQDDRLHKIHPVVDEVAENYRMVYVPTHICMAKSLWKFKGRLQIKQYNPPTLQSRFIKACGYMWNYKIYTGQDRLDFLVSTNVVLLLNENLFDKGYNVYVDNCFSSPDFFLQL